MSQFATLLKERLAKVFSVNLVKFPGTPISTEHLRTNASELIFTYIILEHGLTVRG